MLHAGAMPLGGLVHRVAAPVLASCTVSRADGKHETRPSPPPTITCFVSPGRWTKSQRRSRRSTPSTISSASPSSTRKSSWSAAHSDKSLRGARHRRRRAAPLDWGRDRVVECRVEHRNDPCRRMPLLTGAEADPRLVPRRGHRAGDIHAEVDPGAVECLLDDRCNRRLARPRRAVEDHDLPETAHTSHSPPVTSATDRPAIARSCPRARGPRRRSRRPERLGEAERREREHRAGFGIGERSGRGRQDADDLRLLQAPGRVGRDPAEERVDAPARPLRLQRRSGSRPPPRLPVQARPPPRPPGALSREGRRRRAPACRPVARVGRRGDRRRRPGRRARLRSSPCCVPIDREEYGCVAQIVGHADLVPREGRRPSRADGSRAPRRRGRARLPAARRRCSSTPSPACRRRWPALPAGRRGAGAGARRRRSGRRPTRSASPRRSRSRPTARPRASPTAPCSGRRRAAASGCPTCRRRSRPTCALAGA